MKRLTRCILLLLIVIPCAFVMLACNDKQYEINFYVNNELYLSFTTKGEEQIDLPANPTKQGYQFDGWYLDSDYTEIFDKNAYLDIKLDKNIEVFAKLVPNQYTITFESNGGSSVESITQGYETAVTLPEVPTKDGFGFVGWYFDNYTFENQFTDGSKMPLNGVTLYAKWETVLDISHNIVLGVTDFGKTLEKIAIPDGVQYIAESAFVGCYELMSVNIPDSVIFIGAYAFSGCTALTSITIPENVANIGVRAFSDCSALNTINYNAVNCVLGSTEGGANLFQYSGTDAVLNIGSGVQKILECIFQNSNIKTVNFAEDSKCSVIEEEAFANCKELNSITIPEGITSIGRSAFNNCSNLVRLTIPESVTNIGNYAFYRCAGLTSITISESVTDIGFNAFADCPSLEEINYNVINMTKSTEGGFRWFSNSGNNAVVNIGSKVEKIPDRLFTNSNIKTVNFAEDSICTAIGDNVFDSCEGLTSVTISSSVTSIGSFVFSGCTALISIVVEEGNAVYDSRDNCNAIIETSSNTLIQGCVNTVIPASVTSIGGYAFYACHGLTSITIPSGITSIGSDAFRGCSNLVRLTIPESVTNIGSSIFSGCTALISIVVEEGNAVYDSRDNCNAIIETSSNTLIQGCVNTVIPASVTSIGRYAFYACHGLTSITIPSGVTSIKYSAFNDCDNLTEIIFKGAQAEWEAIDIDESNTKLLDGTITIKFESDIQSSGLYTADGFMTWQELLTTYPDSFSDDGTEIVDFPTDLSGSLVIDASVTSIGDSAFYNCDGITSITIPENVTSIGKEAFYGCDALQIINYNAINCVVNISSEMFAPFMNSGDETIVNIGNKVEIIPSALFYNSEIKTVNFAEDSKCTVLGASAFGNCKNLESITIPASVTTIGYGAFVSCEKFTSITIPKNVTSIGAAVFSLCSNLTNIEVDAENTKYDSRDNCDAIIETETNILIQGCKNTVIPNTVTAIGESAFQNCDGLTSIIIPTNVATIGESAFNGCSSLTSITISNSVTNIGSYAFRYCNDLTEIIFKGTQSEWEMIDKGDYNAELTNGSIVIKFEPETTE